jgi:hypothetical protein
MRKTSEEGFIIRKGGVYAKSSVCLSNPRFQNSYKVNFFSEERFLRDSKKTTLTEDISCCEQRPNQRRRSKSLSLPPPR